MMALANGSLVKVMPGYNKQLTLYLHLSYALSALVDAFYLSPLQVENPQELGSLVSALGPRDDAIRGGLKLQGQRYEVTPNTFKCLLFHYGCRPGAGSQASVLCRCIGTTPRCSGAGCKPLILRRTRASRSVRPALAHQAELCTP